MDSDPLHWDHAVILTGLDVHVVDRHGKISSQVENTEARLGAVGREEGTGKPLSRKIKEQKTSYHLHRMLIYVSNSKLTIFSLPQKQVGRI
jgi:hypothetical protein